MEIKQHVGIMCITYIFILLNKTSFKKSYFCLCQYFLDTLHLYSSHVDSLFKEIKLYYCKKNKPIFCQLGIMVREIVLFLSSKHVSEI